jgi:hypothetical protein
MSGPMTVPFTEITLQKSTAESIYEFEYAANESVALLYEYVTGTNTMCIPLQFMPIYCIVE